ncbi:Hypothetical predicted protein [Paramuricea clavata]|uniref:Uncharacterized protein n=1 Tax=Paramuricea clavata TaxID=317549 RepID=A0A6S7GVR9_PARCT|nr:Hypothetical predicted protein [Paramuricea clavata]
MSIPPEAPVRIIPPEALETDKLFLPERENTIQFKQTEIARAQREDPTTSRVQWYVRARKKPTLEEKQQQTPELEKYLREWHNLVIDKKTGRPPRLPIDLIFNLTRKEESICYPAYANKWKKAIQEAYLLASKSAEKAASKRRKQSDKRVRFDCPLTW